MRVGIATDHGGFSLKEELVARLRAAGHEIIDFGASPLNVANDCEIGKKSKCSKTKKFEANFLPEFLFFLSDFVLRLFTGTKPGGG
jgi:ribose 5-phosphate isomerase RpiB